MRFTNCYCHPQVFLHLGPARGLLVAIGLKAADVQKIVVEERAAAGAGEVEGGG